MAFAKLTSNGRKGRRETEGGGKSDQSDRFMSPCRLSSVEWAHRKEKSQLWRHPASHCGLGTLGLHYHRLNISPFSSTPPRGCFCWPGGSVWVGAAMGLCGTATPILQDMRSSTTHKDRDSQISREVTHLFLTANCHFQTGRWVHKFSFMGRMGVVWGLQGHQLDRALVQGTVSVGKENNGFLTAKPCEQVIHGCPLNVKSSGWWGVLHHWECKGHLIYSTSNLPGWSIILEESIDLIREPLLRDGLPASSLDAAEGCRACQLDTCLCDKPRH